MVNIVIDKISRTRGGDPSNSTNPQVQRTKAHILDSTRKLLIKKGYRNITVDAVSVFSGSSRSTIYRYWPKIEDLLFDAFAELVGEPFESPDTGDFKQDLMTINQLYVDSLQHASWAKILPSFIEVSQNDEHCAELLELLVENLRSSSLSILRNAQHTGQLSKDENIEWIVDVISGSLAYRFLLSKKPLNEKGYIEYLIDAAIKGKSV